MNTKVCSKCKESKPLQQFCKDKNKKDGLRCYCKPCRTTVNKSRYYRHGEIYKQRYKIYHKTVSGRFNTYKQSAKNKELTFDISLEDFESITNSSCFYCGDKHSKDRNYVGIDRINSNVGYIKENCVPCCEICNYMKNNLNINEFREHIIKIFNMINKENYNDLEQ